MEQVVDVSDYVPDDVPVIAEGEAIPQLSLFWDYEGKLLARVTDRISRPTGLHDPARMAYASTATPCGLNMNLATCVVSPNLPVRTGIRCCVQLKAGEQMIKQVRKTIGGWMLESINQPYEPREVRDDEILVMERILWPGRATETVA